MLSLFAPWRPGRRALLGAAATAFTLCASPVRAQGAKYFVRIVEVVGAEDGDVRERARAALEKDLGARPVFTMDLGGADPSADALKARGLRGFDVSLRFESLTKELKDPRPGRRLKQLALGVRISVFGSDVVDGKMAFSGEGESMQMVEVDERRLDKETQGLVADVLADAITQAVDQAVAKLSLSGGAAGKPNNAKIKNRAKKKRS